MSIISVKFKKLHNNVELPLYATEGSAGFDLVAHNFKMLYASGPSASDGGTEVYSHLKTILLAPHSRVLVGCGFSLEIPRGLQLEVRSRSGLTLKQGIIVLNAPGTIDSDYRGEIGVIICNTSMFAVNISLGDRIAQAVLMPYLTCEFNVIEELEETARGEGGYGHTGLQKIS